ncbi:unnamed protein product [Rotaria sordida]|uniref:Uncharacterized protein n=1 Tax=Rotaria sordida TaxID=392033 RepID=A0A815EFP3_9BILA|nr:unnamed protein product [Rotaria sordida]
MDYSKHFYIDYWMEYIIFPIDASIRVCNNGAYLAKCYLESRPPNYWFRVRHYETGLFPVAQCSTIDIPMNAVRNRLECKALAFIAVYKSIFVQEFASAMFNYCYEITGTTLNPKWSQTQC